MSWDHIDGKENTTYLIRFSNGYQRKLVLFRVSTLLEEHHFHDKATVEDIADHSERIGNLADDVAVRMKDVKDKFALQMENQRRVLTGFDHYYISVVGELVFVGVLVVLQVECVKSLLMTTTVI